MFNRAVKTGYVYLFDQDGGCIDFDPSCGETDDDFLDSDETNLLGQYFIDGIGSNEAVYPVYLYYHTGIIALETEFLWTLCVRSQ